MVKRAQYTLGTDSDTFPTPESNKFLRRSVDNLSWEFVSITLPSTPTEDGYIAISNSGDFDYIGGIIDGYALQWNGTSWVSRQPEGTILTPTALSGDVNNYNPTGLSSANYLRLDGGSSDRTITGIQAPTYDKRLTIINIGSTNNIILSHANTNSATGNRFAIGAGSSLAIPIDGAATIWYDTVSQKWRVL